MTEFGKLSPDGTYEKLGSVNQMDIRRCPHLIIAFEHYRADGSCRCNDATHEEMASWGYTWDNERGVWT